MSSDEKLDRVLELQRAILDELRGLRADVTAAHALAQQAHADGGLLAERVKAHGHRLHYVECLVGAAE